MCVLTAPDKVSAPNGYRFINRFNKPIGLLINNLENS